MTKETRSSSPLRIDRKTLRSLLKTLERSGVTDFEYEDEHLRLRIGRGGQAVVAAAPVVVAASAPAAQAAPQAAAQDDADFAFITSPFVGTFYKSPSPEAPTFVEVGSLIKPGQTLCIVEAMKLMNEIESDISGTITEVLVENGKAVEYGQKLYKVRRALGPLQERRSSSRWQQSNLSSPLHAWCVFRTSMPLASCSLRARSITFTTPTSRCSALTACTCMKRWLTSAGARRSRMQSPITLGRCGLAASTPSRSYEATSALLR